MYVCCYIIKETELTTCYSSCTSGEQLINVGSWLDVNIDLVKVALVSVHPALNRVEDPGDVNSHAISERNAVVQTVLHMRSCNS